MTSSKSPSKAPPGGFFNKSNNTFSTGQWKQKKHSGKNTFTLPTKEPKMPKFITQSKSKKGFYPNNPLRKTSSKQQQNFFEPKAKEKQSLYNQTNDEDSSKNQTINPKSKKGIFNNRASIVDSPLRSKSNTFGYDSRKQKSMRRENTQRTSREKRLERYSRRTERRAMSPGGGIKLKFGEMRRSKMNFNFPQKDGGVRKANKSFDVGKEDRGKAVQQNMTMIDMKLGENKTFALLDLRHGTRSLRQNDFCGNLRRELMWRKTSLSMVPRFGKKVTVSFDTANPTNAWLLTD